MDATGDAGYMMALSGDPVGAAKFFAESLSLAVDLEARDRISWALLGAGNLAAEQGDAARAVRLFAAAAAIQQSMQEDLRPSVDVIQERILAEQRQRLGESDSLRHGRKAVPFPRSGPWPRRVLPCPQSRRATADSAKTACPNLYTSPKTRAPVAQGTEHPPSKRQVAGSNPAWGTLN